MIIDIDDPIADYVEAIVDEKTGKNVEEAGILLRTWDTVKRQGQEVRVKNIDDNTKNTLLLDTFTHIPSAKIVLKVPKNKALLIEKLKNEQGVEVKIVS